MDQQNYHCNITVTLPLKEAFESVRKGVSQWWTEDFEGSSQKLNDIFTVRFGKIYKTFQIVEIIENKKIVWQVLDCYLNWLKDPTEWKGTKIVWEFSTENHSTRIDMTHIGLVPEIECYKQCEKGWNFYIKESLFKLLTGKKGLPERKKVSA